MESILLSVQPKWTAKILNGEKTIEVRKRFPKDYVGWVYIYCTKKRPWLVRLFKGLRYLLNLDKDAYSLTKKTTVFNGKVVARFYCDKVEEIRFNKRDDTYYIYRREKMNIGEVSLGISSCLSHRELNEYLQESNGYAIHISQLEIFDKPKELLEYWKLTDDYYWNGKWYHNPLDKAPKNYQWIGVEE